MARLFDGISQYFQANDSPFDFDTRVPFSWGLWLKVLTGAVVSSDIISKGYDAVTFRGWGSFISAMGATYGVGCTLIDTWPVTVAYIQTTSNVGVLDAWEHYVWTYSGSGTAAGLKIYRNGVALGTSTIVNGAPGTILNNLNLHFGYSEIGSGFEVPLKAYGAFLFVVNRELALGEVQQEMIRTGSKVYGSEKGFWPFLESSGTTAYDYSGQGNTGSYVNGPTFSTDSPPILGLGMPDRRSVSGYMAASEVLTTFGGTMPFDSMVHNWLASDE